MKIGSKLINCVRSGLVDKTAVAKSPLSGYLGGAACDVFTEKPAVRSPLFGLHNVICTPHLSTSTKEAQENLSLQMCEFFKNGTVSNALNVPWLTILEVPVLTPWVTVSEAKLSFAGQVSKSAIKALEIEFVGAVGSLNLKPLIASVIASSLIP
tara:strand:- start:12 stop:473 length:462 start_codon:yes stop_codon:yes gene_type:complete